MNDNSTSIFEVATSKGEILKWVRDLALVVVLALFINRFILNPSLIQGSSMVPTLRHRDRFTVSKLHYLISEPERYDIVVFKAPGHTSITYVKRVIGLPDDIVQIIDGKVIVNGEELIEPYLHKGTITYTKDTNEWEIPRGYVFVLGDNRADSIDSRYFGLIEIKSIEGKVTFKYLPLSKMGFVR